MGVKPRNHGVERIEWTEYITPDGQIFKLYGADIYIFDESGYGMPEIDFIEQQSPLQHGVTIYDYRLKPRVVQLTIRDNDCNRANYWTNRNTILDMLRPNRQYFGQFELGTLKKYLPNGEIRALDVIIQQGPAFSNTQRGQWDEWAYQESVRFIAPDPTWYDPALNTESRTYVCSGYHILPFSFAAGAEMTFDYEGDYAAYWSVQYLGTWLSYPTFEITGPLSNMVIWNLSTNKKIDISAYSIVSGETITIDLAFGNKSITSDLFGNILNYISEDSDLADFYLATAPEASGGTNLIAIYGDNATTGYTELYLRYYTRYIGI